MHIDPTSAIHWLEAAKAAAETIIAIATAIRALTTLRRRAPRRPARRPRRDECRD